MKKKNTLLIFGLLPLLCICFTTCANPSFHNPIIEKWWLEEDDFNSGYIAIVKTVPYTVYEAIYETIIKETLVPGDPVTVLQSIKIHAIEYILFSGDQYLYNYPAATGAASNLTEQEKKSNNLTRDAMIQGLINHPTWKLILHGHANPANNTLEEFEDVKILGEKRAEAVLHELPPIFQNPDITTVASYGGDRTLYGVNSTYAALNRRVEMILFEVATPPAP